MRWKLRIEREGLHYVSFSIHWSSAIWAPHNSFCVLPITSDTTLRTHVQVTHGNYNRAYFKSCQTEIHATLTTNQPTYITEQSFWRAHSNSTHFILLEVPWPCSRTKPDESNPHESILFLSHPLWSPYFGFLHHKPTLIPSLPHT